MDNQVAIKEAPSVINDMAARFGMDKRAFEATIRQTCMPANVQVSNEQFAAFLLVAKQYNLNPVTKEIYAFPSKGGIQPIVGIDGWCNIINSQGQLDGIEFEDKLDKDGKLTAILCRISRKDRAKPIEAIEYMDECKRDTQPWKQWPARMLRHKALIQCARYAFSLSGIVEPDEAERMIDVTPDSKRAFSRKIERNDFERKIIQEIDAAKSIDEINKIMESNREILRLMAGGSMSDNTSLSRIEVTQMNAEKRLENDEDLEEETGTRQAMMSVEEELDQREKAFATPLDDIPDFLRRE